MSKKTQAMTGFACKALTLTLGVAVTALSCMGSLVMQTAASLLGFGLACAGAALAGKQ